MFELMLSLNSESESAHPSTLLAQHLEFLQHPAIPASHLSRHCWQLPFSFVPARNPLSFARYLPSCGTAIHLLKRFCRSDRDLNGNSGELMAKIYDRASRKQVEKYGTGVPGGPRMAKMHFKFI
ncbi:uncharacterized protein HD556DRAFT_1302394 [Suillus plorans]|uniref:Uncharacterized protein n=1 Tax=Suillus plorans TaxID=116603 RepID=A0A9P7E3K8_9AGAM|nr:uncharacterized protein HD556DRAFT_1302394 [Suillus plorans]KAG1809993.1 hypothetical protein HD556DRAFT_1302394 [Suillus plorans]